MKLNKWFFPQKKRNKKFKNVKILKQDITKNKFKRNKFSFFFLYNTVHKAI